MWRLACKTKEIEASCRKLSCVFPGICKNLNTDQTPLIHLYRRARSVPGVKKVLIASGLRYDLAVETPEYVKELVTHHVGGYLKIAPEHTEDGPLDHMMKPGIGSYDRFKALFDKYSAAAGKKQYIIPYYIASHPGSDLNAMIDLALFLKRNHYRPDQVQDFIPAPFDVATAMYYTGIDPFTKKPVYVAQHLRDRKLQRALLQFFKPENYFEVRRALEQAGRHDLIGSGCDCLIPARPPKEALDQKRSEATRAFTERTSGDHIRGGPATSGEGPSGPAPGSRKQGRQRKSVGYRPKRPGQTDR
jgi:radical SAM superfamily enzyme YgiQ (UPF0313 family)